MRPLFSGDGLPEMRNQPTEGEITGDVDKSEGRRPYYGFGVGSCDLVLDSTSFGTIRHLDEP